MPDETIAALLNKAIGLRGDAISPRVIAQAVSERRRATDLADLAYRDYVKRSATELQALIEAVVVPETWFFRHEEAFTALGRIARAPVNPTSPARRFRMLSLPCSTGEEPYSMAMALLDAGLAAPGFRVDAVDVSHRALAVGRQGVYQQRSFRGKTLGYRDRYFEPLGEQFRIRDSVQRQLHFQHGNLLNPACLPGTAIYDVIFCRNVLIYLDVAAQHQAVAFMVRLLAPGGFLFVGAAESTLLRDHGLVSAAVPNVLAFCKPAGGLPAARLPGTDAPPRQPVVVSAGAGPEAPPARTSAAAAGGSGTGAGPTDALARGNALANQGRFTEATRCCEEYLRHHDPSAQVFHLLGLVQDAAGRPAEAMASYRKALYLDPHHRDTLVHLALLLAAQNNPAEAQLLRSRARRLGPGSGPT